MTHEIAADTTDDAATSEALPSWDLSDLYAGVDDPDFGQALATLERQSDAFASTHAGRLDAMDGDALAAAIVDYEKMLELLHHAMSYAQLVFAEDMSKGDNARFLQAAQERYGELSKKTLFFTLELNRLDDASLEEKLAASAALRRYQPWLRDVRAFRAHQLDDALEKLFVDKSITGTRAWTRLFDQTLAAMRFPVAGRDQTLADTLNQLMDADRGVRQAAAHALADGFKARIDLFSLVTNTLAKDKEIEDRWRAYPHPLAYRNLANQVEDSVVDALVGSVTAAYPALAHRYYALKAQWLGLEKLAYWDRNAPLPGRPERGYGWEEAKALVEDAFGRFDARIAEQARRFFVNRWVDVPPRPGKDSGAFCHPTVPSAHPYILLNYYGQSRDVTTLAHEVGHGVHQLLAAKQGPLMSDTPLTLAESASVFGEMLVFRALLEDARDVDERRHLLAGKVENMLNTVVRQIAFHEFERRVHAVRGQGELSAERLGEIWMAVQSESLGPAFDLDAEYAVFWAYIPHFVHAPFYVYAYAFGDCLVNSLYQVYMDGHPDFADKYVRMLEAGGTLRHGDLLAPFGLDAGDPGFWRRGLDVIGGFIDELETLS